MISISCSVLEQVRKNHALYAEALIMSEKNQKGGTHGMFAYWQDIAKKIHSDELNMNEGIKELQFKFLRFDHTKRNQEKQSRLLNHLVKYMQSHKKQKFVYYLSRKRIVWNLTPDVRLTGLTPWVFKNDEEYFAYFCIENETNWQTELRFPLLQKYIAEHILECSVNSLSVGVYCLETNDFQFRCFSQTEVRKAVSEVKQLFENVQYEYFKKLELTSH